MIIKSLMNSPVTIDETPFIKDIELNVPKDENKLKAKFTYLNGEEAISIGIIVTSYTLPILDAGNKGLTISVEGAEYKKKIPFNLQIGYNFIKREWFIKGFLNFKKIEIPFKHLNEIPIREILNQAK